MTDPIAQQRLLHVLLGILGLIALVSFLLFVDEILLEIVRHLP